MEKILINTSKDAIEEIIQNDKELYLIKIKCITCSETNSIPYTRPIINGNALIMCNIKYPLKLIETITVHGKYEFIEHKYEKKYKVQSISFQSLLNEESRNLLEEFNLLKKEV